MADDLSSWAALLTRMVRVWQVPYSLIVKVHTLRGEQSVPHMLKELHP